MKAVLEILKRYVFEIVCGAVAAVAIVLGVLGLNSMGEITTEMQQVQQLRTQLESKARSGEVKNSAWVRKAQERIDLIKGSFTSVMDYVKDINQHKPLLASPHTATIQDRELFGRQYQAEVTSWLGRLRAGTTPNEVDVQRELDLMSRDEPKDTFTDPEEKGGDPTGGGMGGGGLGGGGGVAVKDARRQEAAERAAMRVAQGIYCYATKESFQQSEISSPDGPMYDANRPPTREQAWYAQLELWLQRDIVDAIVAVNEKRAAQLSGDNGDGAWVGILPIKEVVSIQMTYYVQDPAAAATGDTSGAGGAPPGGAPPGGTTSGTGGGWLAGRGSGSSSISDSKVLPRAEPPPAISPVFTGRFTNDLHEVLRFSVRLIVDARDIPGVVAGLCEKRFHVPLRVSYEAFSPDPSMTGKIYGEAPLAVLTVDFETVFFSEFYLPMMPDEILQALNKVRPEPQTPTEG